MAKKPPEVIPSRIDESSPEAFLEYRPKMYGYILKCRAAGAPLQALARAANVDVSVIYDVLEHGKETLKDEKTQLAARFTASAHKSTTLLYERLDECSAKDLAIIAGICTDKKLLLEGEPGQIVEHRVTVESVPLNSIMSAAGKVINAEPAPELATAG